MFFGCARVRIINIHGRNCRSQQNALIPNSGTFAGWRRGKVAGNIGNKFVGKLNLSPHKGVLGDKFGGAELAVGEGVKFVGVLAGRAGGWRRAWSVTAWQRATAVKPQLRAEC